jgi:predicted ribosomally synthesized six-cysteine peptide SCIFF
VPCHFYSEEVFVRKMAKHIVTVAGGRLASTREAHRACEGCQTSCQSACKTSCTVGNQVCPQEEEKPRR